MPIKHAQRHPIRANTKGCTGRMHPRAQASVPCQMASRRTLLVAGAMAVIAVAALLPATASAKKKFKVGDDAGWDAGVDYNAWARGKKFKVGDVLEFQYNEGQDVVSVDEQSFHNCVTPDNAQVLGTGVGVDVVLGAPGKYFFICDAEGECESGMKLAITAH